MMMLIGAANRDHRQFPPDGDVFDIHREAASAPGVRRRHALLPRHRRWPGWRAASRSRRSSSASPSGRSTSTNASLSPTSTVRGWDSDARA